MIASARWVTAIAVATALSATTLIAPRAASAQAAPALAAPNNTALNCDKCGSLDGDANHSFWNTWGCTEGDHCFDCHAFNACHGFPQPGACNRWHWACGVNSALLDRAREAAASGSGQNSTVAFRATDGKPTGRLIKNSQRGFIQVLNCQGAVVAQYKIRPSIPSAIGS